MLTASKVGPVLSVVAINWTAPHSPHWRRQVPVATHPFTGKSQAGVTTLGPMTAQGRHLRKNHLYALQVEFFNLQLSYMPARKVRESLKASRKKIFRNIGTTNAIKHLGLAHLRTHLWWLFFFLIKNKKLASWKRSENTFFFFLNTVASICLSLFPSACDCNIRAVLINLQSQSHKLLCECRIPRASAWTDQLLSSSCA